MGRGRLNNINKVILLKKIKKILDVLIEVLVYILDITMLILVPFLLLLFYGYTHPTQEVAVTQHQELVNNESYIYCPYCGQQLKREE